MAKNKFPNSYNNLFTHSCIRCTPHPVSFYPTNQTVGSTVKLIDGTEYLVRPDGSWLKTRAKNS